MLLSDEKKVEIAQAVIEKARGLLDEHGLRRRDEETGLVHTEYRHGRFLLIQHQRQPLKQGFVKTNGIDLWLIEEGGAKKKLSLHYLPFEIKFFDTVGSGEWLDAFLALNHVKVLNLKDLASRFLEEPNGS